MRVRRREAWRVFEKLPLEEPPDSPTAGHYTSLRSIGLDHYLPLPGQEVGGESDLKHSAEILAFFKAQRSSRSGGLQLYNSHRLGGELDHSLEAEGVVLEDLRGALKRHPELLKRYFMTEAVPVGENKLTALHGALWSNGAFLYLPEGVQASLPLETLSATSGSGAGFFNHTLIVAEKGSRLVFLETQHSPPTEIQSLHTDLVEVFVGEGAKVDFLSLQDWSPKAYHFSIKRAVVGRGGSMRWIFGSFGAKLSVLKVATVLRGEEAYSGNFGVFFGRGEQHLDVTADTFHLAPYTRGESLTKGVVEDSATSVYRGLIKIERAARKTDTFLSGLILLMSKTAKANALPSLEINTNDVKAKHSNSVGQIDEEQLFYLMSRGLERREAERMIVEGFFEPILDKISFEEVAGEFRRLGVGRMS